jgi:acetylornithine deacetylase/succinyl-diaminopimelate desuccinylase-like protein
MLRFIAFAAAFAATSAFAQTAAENQRFHDIYKELVETNTTNSVGDNTLAARRMAKHLQDAGFAASDFEILEPQPRKGNLVLRMKGDGSKRPLLLLAHLDVVEAKREDWKTDPFELREDGGYFTARGSIDDKSMAAAFVSILAQLKREGYKPKRDLILALTADEEGGPSNGVAWLVRNRRELVDAEFGLNEGGGGELGGNGRHVLNRMQVAEKMATNFTLTVTNPGGHSSVPVPENAITTLAEALVRIGAHRFPVNVGEVTRAYFGRSAQFVSGQVAADMRAIGEGKADAAVYDRLSNNPFINAQLRTTCVVTMQGGGHAQNALPQSATANVNCRILPHDDPATIASEIRRLAGPKVEVTQRVQPRLSPPSPLRADLMAAVEGVTQEMWPGVPVIPSMSTGATDSLYLRNVGIHVYGVSGMFVEPGDYRAHGLDERITQKALYEGREFLYRLVKRLAD